MDDPYFLFAQRAKYISDDTPHEMHNVRKVLSESGLMLFCPVSRLHSFPNDLRERHYSSVNWTPTKEEDGLRGDKTRKGNLNKKVLKLKIAMFGQRALNAYLIFVIFLHRHNFWEIKFTQKFTQ